ncbi:hypothetical protein LTR53_008444 [Teratosphaeriaceae sp. CCFEE 6253]|nr:hypothetical protein LTR53_008444 [Teratosphaeriaceae sp. CCFEE 6253]
MPPGCLKKTTITIIHPIDSFNPKWTKDQLEKWITHAKGRCITKFTSNTTHVVCTERAWKQQFGEVRTAVAARKNGERVHIVSPEWLECTLREQKREREGAYSWEKNAPLGKGSRKKRKMVDTEDGEETEEIVVAGPKTHGGLLAEVFTEHTNQFVSEGEREVTREAIARVNELKKAKERAEEEERKEEAREQRAVFRKGAKEAKNKLFSGTLTIPHAMPQFEMLADAGGPSADNHHIYADKTGFKYEVTLTKVDTRKNCNERYTLTLQLYESNTEPATYAANLHFAGTGLTSQNTLLATLCSNFATAFRAFKKIFKEKTRVAWDDRVTFAVERAMRAKHLLAAASDRGSRPGRPVSETEVVEAEKEVGLEERAFAYHPPMYGPRGLLPEKVGAVFPEIGPPVTAAPFNRHREEVDLWMRDARGAVSAGAGGAEDGFVSSVEQGKMGAGPMPEGTSDYDQFMSGMYNAVDGNGGAPQVGGVLGQETDGLGETAYPFGSAEAADFDVSLDPIMGHDNDGEMVVGDSDDLHELQTPQDEGAETYNFNTTEARDADGSDHRSPPRTTPEGPGGRGAASPPPGGFAGDDDLRDDASMDQVVRERLRTMSTHAGTPLEREDEDEQRWALPETVPVTQDLGATSRVAPLAAAAAEVGEDKAGAETPVLGAAAPLTKSSGQLGLLGKTLQLGASILGKRRISPVEEDGDEDVATDGEKGDVELAETEYAGEGGEGDADAEADDWLDSAYDFGTAGEELIGTGLSTGGGAGTPRTYAVEDEGEMDVGGEDSGEELPEAIEGLDAETEV